MSEDLVFVSVLKKLSALRKTLRDDERVVLDSLLTLRTDVGEDEVAAHLLDDEHVVGDVSSRSVAGRSVAGRSVSGRSVSGRSVVGRSVVFNADKDEYQLVV